MSLSSWWNNKDSWTKEKNTQWNNMGQVPSRMPPPPPKALSPKPDPLKPIAELENGEVFVIRKYKDVLAHCWLHFKEGEDWRELDDDTLMVKSHVMTMLKLKFTKADE